MDRADLMIKRVKKYISDNNMLPYGSHVVAGISGGADSMCLLFVLMKLARPLGLSLCAVHVHHGLRGAAADNDQKFVESFCKGHGILWKSYRGSIKKMAKCEKMSEEEAGRKFRYECFNRALMELGWTDGKIAVAHNKNDVAETFLMNIFRGTGLCGLASIPAVRGNIIRPLLFLSRREIEELLEAAGMDYCTDQTNLENTYMRNRLRNELIPYAVENINSQAVEHIFELACGAGETAAYIQRQGVKALAAALKEDGGLDVLVLETFDPVIVREVIRCKIEACAGKLKDITREHIFNVFALLSKPVGKEAHLPYGLTVKRGYDAIYFYRSRDTGAAVPNASDAEEITLEIPGNTGIIASAAIPGGKGQIEMTVKEAKLFERIEEKQYTKWFDYDKIKNRLKLRRRRNGDYLVIDCQGSRKLLRRLMIDEKIPKEERDKRWLIADGSHILWMPGSRMSDAYKITSQTKKILEIKIKGEEYNGR